MSAVLSAIIAAVFITVFSVSVFVVAAFMAHAVVVALALDTTSAGVGIPPLALAACSLIGVVVIMRPTLANIAAGLDLMVRRPVVKGDYITIDDVQGLLIQVGLIACIVETRNGQASVPNARFARSVICKQGTAAPLTVRFATSPRADIAKVTALVTAIGGSNDAVVSSSPVVGLDAFGPEQLEFSLTVRVADIRQSQTVEHDLRASIHAAVRDGGIEAPFPQHDVHLRDLDGVKTLIAQALRARQDARDRDGSS